MGRWVEAVQLDQGPHRSGTAVGELWTGAKRSKTQPQARQTVAELNELLDVVQIDGQGALLFGELRAKSSDTGKPLPDRDALIAATALVQRMTLVTHNTSDF